MTDQPPDVEMFGQRIPDSDMFINCRIVNDEEDAALDQWDKERQALEAQFEDGS